MTTAPSIAAAALALALALGCAALASPARAFEGIRLEKPTAENITWSPHYRMTRSAMLEAIRDLTGATPSADAERLAVECGVGVCLVDWDEMSFDGPILRCNERYQRRRHFDRAPDAPHAEALAAGVGFIAGAARRFALHVEEARAATATAAGAAERRARLVGELAEVLHACQDCYSHSNIADELDPALQEAAADLLVRAVTAPGGEAPSAAGPLAAAVKLTAFSPTAGGDPPDRLGYTHDRHAKDGEKHGEGFRRAYALAEATSARVLAALLRRCGGRAALEVLLGR